MNVKVTPLAERGVGGGVEEPFSLSGWKGNFLYTTKLDHMCFIVYLLLSALTRGYIFPPLIFRGGGREREAWGREKERETLMFWEPNL